MERENGALEAELEKRARVSNGGAEEKEEEQKLLEGVAVVDFDVLCTTVALQAQGKWRKLDSHECEDGGEIGGVLRMWEGELLDCFQERNVALESTCCPCYRFGKNMRRAGFGSCFLQGVSYFILAATALLNCIAYIVTRQRCFLYVCVAFTISVGAYLGYYRTQIRKKFNIMGSDSSLDDCVYHMICPCCALCQESRTLEINNVQDGTWRGRGDTIFIGSYVEGSKPLFEVHPPIMSAQRPIPCSLPKSTSACDHSWAQDAGHSMPLFQPSL